LVLPAVERLLSENRELSVELISDKRQHDVKRR